MVCLVRRFGILKELKKPKPYLLITFLQKLILNSKHIFPIDPKYKMHHKIKIYKNKNLAKSSKIATKETQKTSTAIVTEVVIPCRV